MSAVLAEEQKIAGPGAAQITSQGKCVVPPQRLRIGKLRKSAIAKIIGGKAAIFNAKQVGAKGRVGILVLLDIARARSDLGWNPRPLTEQLARYASWLVAAGAGAGCDARRFAGRGWISRRRSDSLAAP